MTSRTLKAMLWSASGAGGQAVVQLAVMVILARLLTPHEFGVAALALVVVAFSEIFVHLGIAPALIQRSSIDDNLLGTAQVISVLLGIIFCGALLGVAPSLATFFEVPSLHSCLVAIAPVFIIQSLTLVNESLLQRQLNFRTLSGITLVSQLIGFALPAVLFALNGYGELSIILAQLLKVVTRSLLLVAITTTPVPRISLSAAADLANFGTGFSIAKVFNFIALQADKVIIGKLLGASALGIYTRAYQFVELASNFVGKALDQVLFPAMAKVQSEKQRLAVAYQRCLLSITLLFLPLSIFAIIVSDEIVYFLLGQNWSSVVAPLQLLFVGLFFRTAYKISDSLVRACGAVYRRAWRQAIYAILVLSLGYLGHFRGVEGVAIGVSAAMMANYVMMTSLSRQLIGVGWKEVVACHGPAALMGGLVVAIIYPTVMYLRNVNMAPLIVLSVAVVLATVLFIAVVMWLLYSRKSKEILWAFDLIRGSVIKTM